MTNSSILPVHNRLNISFSHGKGMYLYGHDGKEYLDFGAGVAVNCLGHCHPNLVSALQKQSEKLWHVSNLYEIKELEQFADKLTKNTFAHYVFFCNSGSEAVECGIKMVRKYFYDKGQPERNRIITFTNAFHGRTIATISAGGSKKNLEGFAPHLDGFDNVEFNNIAAVKKAITKNTAAILIEPIQGEAGINVADKQFIQDLRKLADDNDLLLFFDEVQCGIGRTGYLYAYEYYNVIPDIVSSAKGIGGGFPLGACLATKKAASGMTIGTHGTTYGGNPLAMSVANAVLSTILQEGFLQTVQKNATILYEELNKLANLFPNVIEDIKGVGLMIGIKIKDNYQNIVLINKLKDNSLLTIGAKENVIRLLPALIVEESHISQAMDIFSKTFDALNLNKQN